MLPIKIGCWLTALCYSLFTQNSYGKSHLLFFNMQSGIYLKKCQKFLRMCQLLLLCFSASATFRRAKGIWTMASVHCLTYRGYCCSSDLGIRESQNNSVCKGHWRVSGLISCPQQGQLWGQISIFEFYAVRSWIPARMEREKRQVFMWWILTGFSILTEERSDPVYSQR